MAKYRNQLPQLAGGFFITNGGLETTLVYHKKVELPCFAAFHILKDQTECEWMRNYLRTFVEIAQKYNVGFILESATWRANPDWMRKLGYSDQDVIDVNRKAIELLGDIRKEYETKTLPIVINGCIGPRGDGYYSTAVMSADEAQAYHATQIGVISKTNADMITVLTLNYPDEAIGIARAAKEVGMPIVISFTVETDGKLPTGQTLKEAIELVDEATQNTPAYYMVNCAHPSSFAHTLIPDEPWTRRIHGIKGNASKKSHAELDKSEELDAGNPVEFGEDYRALLYKLKNLNVFGGCCGTDYRHIEEICKACMNTFKQLKGIDHDKIQSKISTKSA
jgi:S-methylmethionine-dependent homocysteine/selenocysteine methylase